MLKAKSDDKETIQLIEGAAAGNSSCHNFNPFPNKPGFFRVCCTDLLKTLWVKEKLLVTSNISFSHNGFYPFGELPAISVKFKVVVCKLFQFGRASNPNF